MERTNRQRESRKKRIRKRQLTRLGIYALLGVLAVLLVIALISLGRKIHRDRIERAEEEALQEEIENATLFAASDVLHLSFPVLTLENEEGVPLGSGLSVSEFRSILQDLYEQNYVLVDLYQLAETTDGGFSEATVMVPSGKKPLILSQQNVSYSDQDDAHASALTRTSGGEIVASYKTAEGVTTTGAVDVVPIVEEFIRQHPDFSYKGARGVLGVTGYRGLFGYQIVKDENIISEVVIEDAADRAEAAADDAEEAAVDLIGDATETEKEEETEIAVEGKTESDALISANKEAVQAILGSLRSNGWHIASNGYGQISYGSAYEVMKEDAEEWQEVIGAIVGTTDILLLPEEADFGNWSGYREEDARYQLLQQQGFRYYCVENDGTKTWAQIRPDYVRQGIHRIDSDQAYTELMAS